MLHVREGPALVREFTARGVRVFLDLKWHDIPSVVAGAVEAAPAQGGAMAPVPTPGGPAGAAPPPAGAGGVGPVGVPGPSSPQGRAPLRRVGAGRPPPWVA